ncbi:MAG: nitroreductase family protein [Thermoplasmatales archaeon]|nr:MAG: nitroreductase family protein [Thermoplasmatales archaeon]
MDVKEAINLRRAYRSLEPVKITEELIYDLAECAQLTASCFNSQPWRYVFVYDSKVLKEMHGSLSTGNEWAKAASMIIVVFSTKEDDCVIRDREYYLFDTGMATGSLILRATELGLVAHPIAGYSPKKTREILGIPDQHNIITLVIVGKHSKKISPVLSDKQVEAEKRRPERIPLNKIVYIDKYKGK